MRGLALRKAFGAFGVFGVFGVFGAFGVVACRR